VAHRTACGNEVKDLLRHYHIRTTKYQLVQSEKDLDRLSVRFPVALKVCSPKILHKTDVGGVRLDIKDANELRKVFRQFRKKFPRLIFKMQLTDGTKDATLKT
jgi:acyl-CoA synthetase (NDP forming)